MDALLLPFLAVAAGLVSFTSPCCLPLIPSYLSYVTAPPVSELGTQESRRLMAVRWNASPVRSWSA